MDSIFGPSPLPLAFLGLWATLPGIWLGAGEVLDLLDLDRAVRRLLRPAVALAAWIVAVQIASMIAKSFWVGLPFGMILLAVAGTALWWWRRSGDAAPASGMATLDPAVKKSTRGMWLGMVVVTVPVALAAFRGDFFDSLLPYCHMGMIAEMLNDYFPPQLLGFTNVPLRYHYGFDLVCAGSMALTRLRSNLTIDLWTIFGWAWYWCLLWVLGEKLTGRRQGSFWVAIAGTFGGGLVLFLVPFAGSLPLANRLLGLYSFHTGIRCNPPFVSYIFQHPFSLGLPFAVALLLLSLDARTDSQSSLRRESRWTRPLVIGLLLAGVYLTQTMLFLALTATFAFTEIIVARRWRFGVVLIAVFVAAWAMGGMLFTHVPDSPAVGLKPQFWLTAVTPEFAGQPVWRWTLRVLAWQATVFGALLPLGIWGLWRVRRLRWSLLLLAGGGFVVPLFVTYEYGWDIVKFTTIAELALAISSGVALSHLALKRSAGRRVALVAWLVVLLSSPIVYIATILWEQSTAPDSAYAARPVALSKDDRDVVAWLRTRLRPNDLVYRLPEVATGYCQWGGLPSTPPPLHDPQEYGISLERLEQRDELLKSNPPDFAAYRALGIKWFVVGPDDPVMERNVREWEQSGLVVEEAKFGALRIFTFAEPANSPAEPKS